MPELPEVETVRIGLQKLLVGHTITGYHVLREKSFPNELDAADQFVVGAKVTQVRRRAKLLLIDLSSKHTLAVHLKMTGQLVYRGAEQFGAGHPSDSLVDKLPDNTTRVVLDLDRQAKLYFNDQRVFGWVKLVPTPEVGEMEFVKKLGPEPLGKEFTLSEFKQQLSRRKNSRAKAVLLDQSVVAGIGNIYADEALWAARIHPETRVSRLSAQKLALLHKSIIEILKAAIRHGGSTDRNYVDAEGNKGSYLGFARVFRREGLDCPRCGRNIIKIRSAGRGTHLCASCQRLSK
ncbi:MAG: bifunctional DNA-formamidopyrimidine glycosylase/DNA-(apurinic or apyrimidinic site) lyase [Candidatus Saccharimonadales bacterium]|nr:bifunctional DNA-formamidopyrimidine glycosylase/DNA-(apurinic or apyrimidinic site) lyase [Candidatus Saccharimonadales bacterium]